MAMYSVNDYRYYRSDELCHFGILGQKWGRRRYQNEDGSLTDAGRTHYGYGSTSIRAAIARRSNEKVDKSFKKWKENSVKKEDAISLGKTANLAKRTYESDPTKENKIAYKKANKEYKKSLSKNTTYRKGQVKKEVESDLSRKYLSDAKKVKKQLDKDPSNRDLNKQYSKLMSQHDIYRASARRAPEVAAARSRRKATFKRGVTIAAKSAATAAVISVGASLINTALGANGSSIRFSSADFDNLRRAGKGILKMGRYVYF